ncbi:MAG: SDR family oxidoreductase [Candidatus Cyclobacteriaceae bacterium M3_2C_046]
MKILFIGGTGNISTACTRLASQKGMDVFILNRGTTAADIPSGVKTIQADYSDLNSFRKAVEGHYFDVVANFIAFTEDDVKKDFEVLAGKTAQYIFISSASAYQKPLSHPVITESTPLKNPYWQYSRDKIACEDFLIRMYREEDFPVTIVRPSLTYETVIPVALGSWTDYTIIDRIKKGKKVIIHGDGTSLWTITHSRDFALGFVGLLGHQQAIGENFHITSDEILNWNQIYQAVADAAGASLQAVHIPSDYIARFDEFQKGNLLGDKAVSTIFDNSKIKRYVPDFKAVIPFKQGIKETVKWFEANPARMKILEENNLFLDKVIGAFEKLNTNV